MIRYCYKIQAWVINGFVAPCGHAAEQVGCYSCSHEGTAHHLCEGCGPAAFDSGTAYLLASRVQAI